MAPHSFPITNSLAAVLNEALTTTSAKDRVTGLQSLQSLITLAIVETIQQTQGMNNHVK